MTQNTKSSDALWAVVKIFSLKIQWATSQSHGDTTVQCHSHLQLWVGYFLQIGSNGL